MQPLSGGGLILVDASGNGVRRVFTDRLRCGSPRHPRWSPDGSSSFAANALGGFSAPSCTLTGTGTAAACSVTFRPAAAGTVWITAGYGSDRVFKRAGSAMWLSVSAG